MNEATSTELDQIEDDDAPVLIECSNQSDLLMIWVITLIWGAISVYSLSQFDFQNTNWQQDGPLATAVLVIFGGGTLLLILRSIYKTFRWKKFGKSVLELKGSCGIIGKKLEGRVIVSKKFVPTGPYEIVLECLKTETYYRSGKQRTKTTSVWKEKKSLEARTYSGVGGIPINFDIPSTCLGIGEGGYGQISWTLTISAPLPGVNYRAPFDVPVYSQESFASQYSTSHNE